MNNIEFNKHVKTVLKEVKSRFKRKVTEYANDDDRLHNFKHIADFMQQNTAVTALTLLMKNFTSLRDKIVNKEDMSKDFIDEKLIDTLCYLLLLYAIVIEKKPIGINDTDIEQYVEGKYYEIGERFLYNNKIVEVCWGYGDSKHDCDNCIFSAYFVENNDCHKKHTCFHKIRRHGNDVYYKEVIE